MLIAALLLLPLAYYVSHFLAVTAHDYRYMYPATLLLQILVACPRARPPVGGWRPMSRTRVTNSLKIECGREENWRGLC